MRSKIAWSFAAATALVGTGVAAKSFGDWSAPVNAETLAGSSSDLNTASNDGCPILNPYDDSLYRASNRPGGQGGLDIWIAPRSGDGWGTPVNAGPAINTAADEFCPTPARGNRFFFVRRLSATDTDIYVVKDLPNKGFGTPQRLQTGATAINSPSEEGSQGTDIYSATRSSVDEPWESAVQLGNGINSAGNESRASISWDGTRLMFGTTRAGGEGAADIWTSTRE